MLKGKIIITIVLVCALVTPSSADFVLTGTQHLDVLISDNTGSLSDSSTADILPGGSVDEVLAHNDSTVTLSGGFVHSLDSYDTSSVVVNSGMIGLDISTGLQAFGKSVVVSGGSIGTLWTFNACHADISGGFIDDFGAAGSSTVDFSGGIIGQQFNAYQNSTVNFSGGTIESLEVGDSSIATFYGYNFIPSDGLRIAGNEVFGTGTLSGTWLDGQNWEIQIRENDASASILLVPEPTTLLLLGLGGVLIRRRK